MYQRFATVVLGLMAVGALSTPSCAAPQAAAQESPYKDQGEYDLANSAGKEADPQKKLDKLKEWDQKYPDSKLKNPRTLMQAQALLGIASAAYGKTDPAVLDAGQKAAQQIVDNMDNYFSDSVKPAGATDDQWKAAKHQFEETAHSVLAWVDMTKKTDPLAEAEFKKVLELDPTAAQASYSLGSVIIRQKNVARYSEALYDIARAVSVTGTGALSPEAKKVAEDFLKRAYNGYHGSDEGLDQLKATAAGAPLPPSGFHVDSVAEIEAKKFGDMDAFNKAHPDIALWRQIRDTLKGDGGDAYFGTVKGSQIPPENIAPMFKAKIVTVNDKDLVVNIDNAGGDGTLKFEKTLNAKVINVGDAIEFKAVVDSFTKEPYMLTLTIADPKEDIKGLPDNAFAPPAAKKPAVRKTTKKK